MRDKIYKHTLPLVLLFAVFATYGQKKYDSNTKATTRSLEGKNLSGYETVFGYGRDQVRRGWWSYAREFGTPLDMRDYYKVTIPSETTDGNVDLVVFTQTVEQGSDASFYLGVENSKYKEQAKLMLLDFKKMYYIQTLVTEIESKQEIADELGKSYKKNESKKERQELLKKVKLLEEEIEGLKNRIKQIERK